MKTTNQVQESVNQDVLKYINSNPVVYGLQFAGYENGKMIFTEPSRFSIKDAITDLDLFQKRQEAINARTKISEGDWIIRKSGNYERISVACYGHIQAGGTGSVYINESGNGSYSGSCGDCIEKYELTDEAKEGSCWIFSQDRAGAHRGVYNKLQFKVYREI